MPFPDSKSTTWEFFTDDGLGFARIVSSEWRIELNLHSLFANSPHVSIFTYSKSPGLLSMPTFGGEIQLA
jgi:hypothetical protein